MVTQNTPPFAWTEALRDAAADYRRLVAFVWSGLVASALLITAVADHASIPKEAKRGTVARTDPPSQFVVYVPKSK